MILAQSRSGRAAIRRRSAYGMGRGSVYFLCLLWAGAPARADYALEQVMSSPFPSQLVAARQGSRVAWVFDVRGERNVWVADGPGFVARQVTRYTGDDGHAISGLQITPDGHTLVYARGSETNRAGEVGDPTSGVEEREQQVWAVDADGGEPRLLGELNCEGGGCEDIQLSPDGQWAVWPARRQLWIAPLSAAEKAKPLFYARGTSSQPRWSPDAKRLAFVSDREDHRFIGVYTFSENHIRWIAPSVDRDAAPRWSPDGEHLAFLRIPGRVQALPLLPLQPTPWAIWSGDPAAGTAREIWRSSTRPEDSLPPGAAAAFFYLAGDRVVFPSEQDGRYHLYSIPASGGAPVLLTPGDFDVEEARPGADPSSLLYTSNQDDVDRRHVWRVRVEGGLPEALTGGESIEWSPVETGDGKHVLCLGSDATTPAMPHLVTASGRVMLVREALSADFPSRQLVVPRQVVYRSKDGYEIHGQLFVPQGRAGRAPAVVFAHGGPPRQMMLGFHNRQYYHNCYAANQYLASRGFVVLSVNFRLGIMYGRAFREPPDAGWRGASEYRDVVAAARYLQSLPEVDPKRIGLWGGSYGGYLTALGLARDSALFAAGVDVHGVHDWSVRVAGMAQGTEPPDLREALRRAYRSSPVASLATWKSPVLLIHGDDDRNVAFSQTTDLVQRLRQHEVPFEQLVFPDEIHGFLLWRNWITAFRAMEDFFQRRLKAQEAQAATASR